MTADQEVCEQLGLPEGSEVHHLRRLRLVDGRPLALMENWLPLTVAELDSRSLETDGLYNILRRAGVDFRMAHQKVGARIADAEQARRLKVEQGSALVLMERTALDSSGAPVEFGKHVYRADRYSFDIMLVD